MNESDKMCSVDAPKETDASVAEPDDRGLRSGEAQNSQYNETEANKDATETPEVAETNREKASDIEEGALEDKVSDLTDRLLRAMAETENLRKRSLRDREDARKYAITEFARDLLGIVDNLRRALESVPDDGRGADETLDNLLSGVEMTERELSIILDRNGIKPINPISEKFDPKFHQAMFEIPSGQEKPGTIVEVVQIGYMIADRLLRPACVGISAGSSDASNTKPNDGDTNTDSKDAQSPKTATLANDG